MELISLLITAAATQAVKALIRGQGPGQADLAGAGAAAVEQLLGAVLQGQNETQHSLTRIEQKIDAIGLDSHRIPLEVGFRNLREAAQPHRKPVDRLRLLNDAEQQFATAVVSAPTLEAAVRAELLSATCWLAKGSPTDFYARTRHAADVALRALATAYEHFAGPLNFQAELQAEFERRAGVGGRISRLFSDGTSFDDPRLAPIRVEIRRRLRVEVVQRLEDFNQIQAMRLEYAAPLGDCPRIEGIYRPGNDVIAIADGAELSSAGHLTGALLFALPLGVPTRVGDVVIHLEAASVSSRQSGCSLVDGVMAWQLDTECDPQHRLSVSANWFYLGRPEPPPEQVKAVSAATPFLPQQIGLPVWNGGATRFAAGTYRCALRLAAVLPQPQRVVIHAQRIQGIDGVSNTPGGFGAVFETPLGGRSLFDRPRFS